MSLLIAKMMSVSINSLSETGLRYEEVSYIGKGVSSYDKYSYVSKPTATQLENMCRTLTFSHPINFLLGGYCPKTKPDQVKLITILTESTSLLPVAFPTEWDADFEFRINGNCLETKFGWVFTFKTNTARTQISFAAFNYLDETPSSLDESIKRIYAASLMLENSNNKYIFYGFY